MPLTAPFVAPDEGRLSVVLEPGARSASVVTFVPTERAEQLPPFPIDEGQRVLNVHHEGLRTYPLAEPFVAPCDGLLLLAIDHVDRHAYVVSFTPMEDADGSV